MTRLFFDQVFQVPAIEASLVKANLLHREMILLSHDIYQSDSFEMAELFYSFGSTIHYFRIVHFQYEISVNDLTINKNLLLEAFKELQVYDDSRHRFKIQKLERLLANALSLKANVLLGSNPKNMKMLEEYSNMYVV